MKIFRGSSAGPGQIPEPAQTTKRLSRRSSGLAELAKSFASEEPLCVLDLGSTSAANIRYLTERGHKLYSEDLLVASTDPALAMRKKRPETRWRSRPERPPALNKFQARGTSNLLSAAARASSL